MKKHSLCHPIQRPSFTTKGLLIVWKSAVSVKSISKFIPGNPTILDSYNWVPFPICVQIVDNQTVSEHQMILYTFVLIVINVHGYNIIVLS